MNAADNTLTAVNLVFIASLGWITALVPLVLAVVMAQAQRRHALRSSLLLAGFLYGWLAVALWVTQPQLFGASGGSGGGFFTSFGSGLLIGCALLLGVPAVRREFAAIPPHWPVRLQTARIVGGFFIVWAALGAASWTFALVAGLGDLLVGLSAWAIAARLKADTPKARQLAFGHALFGLADFALAFTVAQAPGARLVWPGQLIPAFLVPLAMLLHGWLLLSLWTHRRAVPSGRVAQKPDKPHPANRQGAASTPWTTQARTQP